MNNKNKKPITSLSVSIDYSKYVKISPIINSYNVRILYLEENRNDSYFTEEIVKEMIGTLGGIPVVGQYDKDKEDFLDHGKLVISVGKNGEIESKKVGPVPYGFVPLDAETWWAEHLDKDGVTRNYLHTKVYMWSGRYPELETLKDGLNNHSMELNPKTMDGTWSENGYYVVTKAEFMGLCILGKDVEPCFEGAGIEPNFELSSQFSETLISMKEELARALESEQQQEPEVLEELDDDEVVDNTLDNLEGPTEDELLNLENNEAPDNLTDENLLEIDQSIDDTIVNDDIDYEDLYNKKEAEFQTLLEKYNEEHEELLSFRMIKEKQEKKIELEKFKCKMDSIQYEKILNNIDNYTLVELVAQAKDSAYSYMESLFELQQSNDSFQRNSDFTLLDNENPTRKNDYEEWQLAVLQKQKER